MSELILAAIFLLASHFGLSSTSLRPWLIQRLGTSLYLGLYSLLAFAAFIWLALAYGRADHISLWSVRTIHAWIILAVMLIAVLFLIGGLTTQNPTIVGKALIENRIDPPTGILRITRHPTMWAFGLWALSHLLMNGDVASLILFGTIALLALIGTTLIDKRYRQRLGSIWSTFDEQTSNLPFRAILSGRQHLALSEIGWWRVALAIGLYVFLLAIHPWLIGVSPVAFL